MATPRQDMSVLTTHSYFQLPTYTTATSSSAYLTAALGGFTGATAPSLVVNELP